MENRKLTEKETIEEIFKKHPIENRHMKLDAELLQSLIASAIYFVLVVIGGMLFLISIQLLQKNGAALDTLSVFFMASLLLIAAYLFNSPKTNNSKK